MITQYVTVKLMSTKNLRKKRFYLLLLCYGFIDTKLRTNYTTFSLHRQMVKRKLDCCYYL